MRLFVLSVTKMDIKVYTAALSHPFRLFQITCLKQFKCRSKTEKLEKVQIWHLQAIAVDRHAPDCINQVADPWIDHFQTQRPPSMARQHQSGRLLPSCAPRTTFLHNLLTSGDCNYLRLAHRRNNR